MKILVTHYGVPKTEGKKSEDAMRVLQHEDRLIAVVADGLGSCREGGEAAHRAAAMMVDYFHARPQAWSPRRALAEFTQQINKVLHQESMLRHGEPELLCTLSVVVVEGGLLYGLNVGDSPIYLWRKGNARCLSECHCSKEPGMEHVLVQALGMAGDPMPANFEIALEDKDMVLVCSDGLSNALREPHLGELLGRRVAARALVQQAQAEVEKTPELMDDVSAIVLDVERVGPLGAEAVRELDVITELQSGDKQDNFVLLHPLHEGGRVWLAKDPAGHEHVLKFPPLEAAEDEGRRDAFLREIWHATRIDSPEFVRSRLPHEGTLRYYIIEYIKAPTLAERLKQGPLRVEEGIELGRFLLRAAQYLLARDHVHGDIKPENILLQETGEGLRFKMIDLGSTAGVLSMNSRAGTPSYLAPERFLGAAISERSEVFSIGVTLYEALTKHLPFGEIERFQTPSFSKVPRRAWLRNPAIPGWLDSVLQRALSVDINLRYQSFSEMFYELENPGLVRPFHAKGVPLVERNPVRFYKAVILVLLFCNFVLIWVLLRVLPVS